MRRLRRLGDTSGATALEFALISPVFLLMVVGGFQLAWAMHCAASVRWSLETNARSLMLNPAESPATLKSAMLTALGSKVAASDLNVAITQDTSNAASKLLVATSTYRTNLSVPFVHSQALTFTSVTKVPTP